MEFPPPLPRKPGSKSFAHHAAMASWMAPLIAFSVSFVGVSILANQPPEYQRMGKMVLGGAACLMILAGLVLGVVALCGMAKRGTKGILGPALLGIILCGLITVMGLASMPALERARARAEAKRKSLEEIRESEKQIHEAARKQLMDGSVSNTDDALEKRAQLQKSFENAAQNMNGNDALVMKASGAYTQKLNGLMTNYDAALKEVTAAKILEPSRIKDKVDLVDHRLIVEHFLTANDELRNFIEHGADNYRAEFDRLQVPQYYTDAAIRSYRTKADLINPLLAGMRQKDEIIGKGMLKIIALQEANWGHWKVSGADSKIRFENTSVATDYNTCLKEIRLASAEETKLKKRIFDASNSGTEQNN